MPDQDLPIEELDGSGAARLLQSLGRLDDAHEPDAQLPHLEGYVLDARIGHGSGGEVYRGRRADSACPLAIKILHQPLGSQGARRIWRELEALSQLRLECVPRLLDYGVEQGRLFLVTEFVEGTSLLEYVDARQMSRRERVALLAQTADAVQQLHERGIIHRDLKPANLLVTPDGRPVVIDFGLAALVTQDPIGTLTVDGSPIGTIGYMPPEQARGERQSISTRSDVYSLGAIGYRLICDHTPHETDGPADAVLRRIAREPSRDPRKLDRGVPRPLAAILQRATSLLPGDRYPSAAALAEDLRRFQRGDPPEAGGRSLRRLLANCVGRHPFALTVAGCGAIAIGTLLATTLSVYLYDRRPSWVEFDADRSEVVLHAASGRRLREPWNAHYDPSPAPAPPKFDGSYLLPRPAGGRLLVIPDGRDGVARAFDVDADLERPVWTARVLAENLPGEPWTHELDPGDFSPKLLAAFDIFDPPEGLEIVIVHQNRLFTACAIHVYSIDGLLLYQVWHDGNLTSGHWDPATGQLIFAGFDGRSTWSDLGWQGDGHPPAVCAITPVRGDILGRWLDPTGSDPVTGARWYRWLHPVPAGHRVELQLLHPRRARSGQPVVQLELRIDKRDSLTWLLDAQGDEIPATRVLEDSTHDALARDPAHYLRSAKLVAEPPGSWLPND